MMKIKTFFPVGLLVLLVACGHSASQSVTVVSDTTAGVDLTVGADLQSALRKLMFNADSAYQFVQAQTDFGARVPNSEAHKACAAYLAAELQRFGAKVTVQQADLRAFGGTMVHARNIIGSFRPEATERILLAAHWDSRPFADHDPNPDNWRKAIDGANDGASGVGVLLEVARLIGRDSLARRGVDIIFFDAEDGGEPVFSSRLAEDTWCLGSQYWARNARTAGYRAEFGILLDMVGGRDAVFLQERVSMHYAAPVVERVWKVAQQAGYGRFFKSLAGGAITDDHLYINQIAEIPCIDIIDFDPKRPKGFPDTWHTLSDTMKNIDRETLKAVGQTILIMINH